MQENMLVCGSCNIQEREKIKNSINHNLTNMNGIE